MPGSHHYAEAYPVSPKRVRVHYSANYQDNGGRILYEVYDVESEVPMWWPDWQLTPCRLTWTLVGGYAPRDVEGYRQRIAIFDGWDERAQIWTWTPMDSPPGLWKRFDSRCYGRDRAWKCGYWDLEFKGYANEWTLYTHTPLMLADQDYRYRLLSVAEPCLLDITYLGPTRASNTALQVYVKPPMTYPDQEAQETDDYRGTAQGQVGYGDDMDYQDACEEPGRGYVVEDGAPRWARL